MDVNLAESWFIGAVDELSSRCTSKNRNASNFKLEIFIRAVVTLLLGKDGHCEFPETFYLDHDRLRVLKAEIDELVCLEICTDLFVFLAERFGSAGCKGDAAKQLRASIAAIMSETTGQGFQYWMANSEAVSLEILRQASSAAGRPPSFHFDYLSEVHQQLQMAFSDRFNYHAAHLEKELLPQILCNVERHATSSPMDLFVNLATLPPAMRRPSINLSRPLVLDIGNGASSHLEVSNMANLVNRITHIIILHWRTWSPIAYVQDERSAQPYSNPAKDEDLASSTSPQSKPPTLSSLHITDETHQVMTAMKTGELPDTGQEAHIEHQTQTQ